MVLVPPSPIKHVLKIREGTLKLWPNRIEAEVVASKLDHPVAPNGRDKPNGALNVTHGVAPKSVDPVHDVFGHGSRVGAYRNAPGQHGLHGGPPERFPVRRQQKAERSLTEQLLALLKAGVANVFDMIRPVGAPDVLRATLTGHNELDAHPRACVDGDVSALVAPNAPQCDGIRFPLFLGLEVAKVKVVWNDSPIPLRVAMRDAGSAHKSGPERVALVAPKRSKSTARSNPGLDDDQVTIDVGRVGDRVPGAPKRQHEIATLFALQNFGSGILVKHLIGQVSPAVLKKSLLPIVATICSLQNLVVGDADVLVSVNNRVSVPVMDGAVLVRVFEHGQELPDLLGERACDIVCVRDRVRQC